MAKLNLPTLLAGPAWFGRIMSDFTNNLVSIGKLCLVTFMDLWVTVWDCNGATTLQGQCEQGGVQLWQFHLRV